MYWRRLSTRGAVSGGLVGFVSSISLIVMGPKVWVSVIGNSEALFPYDYPALFTLPLALSVMIVVSYLDKSEGTKQDQEYFDKQLVTVELGTSVAKAVKH
jgi:cation/acetate symporter